MGWVDLDLISIALCAGQVGTGVHLTWGSDLCRSECTNEEKKAGEEGTEPTVRPGYLNEQSKQLPWFQDS